MSHFQNPDAAAAMCRKISSHWSVVINWSVVIVIVIVLVIIVFVIVIIVIIVVFIFIIYHNLIVHMFRCQINRTSQCFVRKN